MVWPSTSPPSPYDHRHTHTYTHSLHLLCTHPPWFVLTYFNAFFNSHHFLPSTSLRPQMLLVERKANLYSLLFSCVCVIQVTSPNPPHLPPPPSPSHTHICTYPYPSSVSVALFQAVLDACLSTPPPPIPFSPVHVFVSASFLSSPLFQAVLDACLSVAHLVLSAALPSTFFGNFIWVAILKVTPPPPPSPLGPVLYIDP